MRSGDKGLERKEMRVQNDTKLRKFSMQRDIDGAKKRGRRGRGEISGWTGPPLTMKAKTMTLDVRASLRTAQPGVAPRFRPLRYRAGRCGGTEPSTQSCSGGARRGGQKRRAGCRLHPPPGHGRFLWKWRAQSHACER